jgi:hypothetical protein
VRAEHSLEAFQVYPGKFLTMPERRVCLTF